MIKITTNLGKVAASLQDKFKRLQDRAYVNDKLVRTVASDVIQLVAQRIHVDGKKADGSQIGEYSTPYMRVRNKNKRDSSKRVIFSLTGDMEDDFSVIATDKGYGLGFKFPESMQKAKWLTVDGVGKNKKKFDGVYQLSTAEKLQTETTTKRFLNDHFATH